jgi:putative addiction module killer protein
MIEVRETDPFAHWLAGLRDDTAKAKIAIRVRRLAFGNPGDIALLGEGLSEMRIHYGPGYRIYLVQRGPSRILLLGGGDKSTQNRDILRARALAKDETLWR